MIYQWRSRLSGKQQGRLIDLFLAGATARAAAEMVGGKPEHRTNGLPPLHPLIASKLPSYDLVRFGDIVSHLLNLQSRLRMPSES